MKTGRKKALMDKIRQEEKEETSHKEFLLKKKDRLEKELAKVTMNITKKIKDITAVLAKLGG